MSRSESLLQGSGAAVPGDDEPALAGLPHDLPAEAGRRREWLGLFIV